MDAKKTLGLEPQSDDHALCFAMPPPVHTHNYYTHTHTEQTSAISPWKLTH